MMRSAFPWAVAALALTTLSGSLAATASAQSDPNMAANERMEAAIKGMIAFTKDVNLDERRLQRVLAHAAALDGVVSDEESDALLQRALADGGFEFGVIVAHPDYVAWCRGRELDPRGFLKDLTRLEALIMRQESAGELQTALAGIPEQRRQWEQMRGKVGEETYQAALAAISASEASIRRSIELIGGIPEASEEEARLLLQHRDAIRQALAIDQAEEGSRPEEPGAEP